MTRPQAIFLCDFNGIMAREFEVLGWECWCVDIKHSIRKPRREGNVWYVWGDARTWSPPEGVNPSFVGAHPICTHTSGSGARDFETKGTALYRDRIELFESCRTHAKWSGAPYFIENTVGVLSSVPHIGKPDHYFHPNDYAGYLEDQSTDAYTKKTCLWVGNGFVMPDRKPVDPIDGSKMHLMAPSDDRERLRSATPRGFCRAVALEHSKAA